MNLNEYQEHARDFRLPTADAIYAYTNLAAEIGELLGVIAKARRDRIKTDQEAEEFLTKIRKESGDILWQLCAVLDDYGLSLEEVGYENLDKLASRKIRGKINGSGDDR